MIINRHSPSRLYYCTQRAVGRRIIKQNVNVKGIGMVSKEEIDLLQKLEYQFLSQNQTQLISQIDQSHKESEIKISDNDDSFLNNIRNFEQSLDDANCKLIFLLIFLNEITKSHTKN